jgi:hypothetical protein
VNGWTVARRWLMPQVAALLAAVAAVHSLNLVPVWLGGHDRTAPGHTSTSAALVDAVTGNAVLPLVALLPGDVFDLSVAFTGDVVLPSSFGSSLGTPARWFWVSMGGRASGPGGLARYAGQVSLFNDGVPLPVTYQVDWGVANALNAATTLAFGAGSGPASFALLAVPELPTTTLLGIGAAAPLLRGSRARWPR